MSVQPLTPSLQPTPYADINRVLLRLLSGAQAVLGDNFFGLYLYGSLSSGDFNPGSSDVDFLVVTRGPIEDADVAKLERLHLELLASGDAWTKKLEGTYLPLADLRRYDPEREVPRPAMNEGQFYLAPCGWDWIIQRHILREQGVAVQGPPLRDWIDPVGPDDLRRSILGILDGWWEPMLHDPHLLARSDYQAFAILSMCRVLYTLRRGEIASKPQSARWAQGELASVEPRWVAAIQRALDWHYGVELDDRQVAIEMIRSALDVAQNYR